MLLFLNSDLVRFIVIFIKFGLEWLCRERVFHTKYHDIKRVIELIKIEGFD